jgi:hypothetical protein
MAGASNDTNDATRSLAQDPKTDVDRIDGLARRVLTGDIQLPKFQRGFVWDRQQILSLLDSISRGYPIGSLLLWRTDQRLQSERQIADLEDIQFPEPDYPVNYLLDGQQRLSTICGALYWRGKNLGSRWNLAYDLREQQFITLPSLDDPPLHQIRLNKLSDPAAFFRHVYSLDTLTGDDVVQLRQRSEELFNRFKDYKLATVTLAEMSIEGVAPIFERINSQGTQLTVVDLMRAATWRPDFDLLDEIERIQAALAEKDFQTVEPKVLLRSIAASAGLGFTVGGIDQLRDISLGDLQVATSTTLEAYERTVDFLGTDIGVASADIIPYGNQLIVLADVFRQVPHPSAGQRREVAQWFWNTAALEYFSGWNTGQMGRDKKAVDAFATGKGHLLPKGMEFQDYFTWLLQPFRSNNALSKLLAIILAHHQPRDLLTGQPIDTQHALAWSNVREFHHFFPKEYLVRKKVTLDQANTLANIVMLTSVSNKTISDRAPSDYLAQVEKDLGVELRPVLESNLISTAAFRAAKEDNYQKFLEQRAKDITKAVRAKIEGVATSGT